MMIYVFSRLDKNILTYSGRNNLGYYSTLEKAYNKLKKYIDNIPTLEYIDSMIKRNRYYDIIDKSYTSEYRIKIEKLDDK